MSRICLSPALAALAGLLLMVAALSACGEDPSAPQAPDPDRTVEFLVPAPTATRVPAPTATPAPTAIAVPTPEEFALTATTATTWGDAFSTFTGPQQDCIRDALGQNQLNSFLRKTIMTSEIDDYSNLTGRSSPAWTPRRPPPCIRAYWPCTSRRVWG